MPHQIPPPAEQNERTDENERLREALADANIPTLVLVLAQLTGDKSWLEEPYRPQRGKPLDDNDSGGLTPEIQQKIRDAAADAVIAYRAGDLHPANPTPDEVARMLSVALVESVPESYGPLLSEEMGLISRDVDLPPVVEGRAPRIVIIGSGLSGLCTAIKLRSAGLDFTILEKDPDLGGTWLENVYPGCGVDTPSHLYSFSFEPNTKWSRYFAKRGEVFEYLSRLADEHDVRRHIRFRTEVVRADYDVEAAVWRVEIHDEHGSTSTLETDILISAVGMVNRPSVPPIPGLDTFPGPFMHTAEWDPNVDLSGKHVAVIGTGASAMQLVPSIADEVEKVTVFQRSKQWALPHPNYHRNVAPGTEYLLENVPFYGAWYRLRAFWNFSDRLHPSLQIDPSWPHPERSINADNERHRIFLTKYIESELGDRQDLLDACLPDYPPYGKRPLLDNGWFRTVRRDDVDLVTEAVAEVRGNTIVTASGGEYQADVLVLATGFKTLQFLWPMEIRGTSGQTLRDQWGKDDARAYLGVTVPDFPNFFIVNGPNTNAGHGGSAVIATEFQVRYIMQAIGHLIANDLESTEVREEVFREYNEDLDEALSRSIWSHQGMTTYYRNDAGRIVISSPWKYIDYWQRTLEFDRSDYVDEPRRAAVTV
ncbi:NAD(P)/FAD-dependent oxidoreductase [Rhodococcus olei]|uniref:NAD(P)/FAD-dependent oxidoreductase n=1 Tax=Rhodococcus olei TaxID=2161675 RepID=A0ABP8PTL8_9NOCA